MTIELKLRFRELDYNVVLPDETWPSVETAAFYYTDGNGACDCALADLIRRREPTFPEMLCGNRIEMRGIVIDGSIVNVDGVSVILKSAP